MVTSPFSFSNKAHRYGLVLALALAVGATFGVNYLATHAQTDGMMNPATQGGADMGAAAGMSNTSNRTWTFKDGSTSSAILNRKDAEYTNYLATIQAQCSLINMSQYRWKTGAGDSTATNWQNFGIPDCSGSATDAGTGGGSSGGSSGGNGGGNGSGSGTQVSKTWTYKDGTSSSMVLNRTDAEYTNYLATIQAQCSLINMSQYRWKSGAGDSTATNWQNFGIPDCSSSAITGTTGSGGGSGGGTGTGTGSGDTTRTSNTVNHTWTFKDGTSSSMILNRTDAEYTNYLATIQAQCSLINMSQYRWKSGAGDSTATNWQNFGIPDCSGTTTTGGGNGGGGGDGSHSNWVSKTWTFNDGTSNSMILNRTDSEYLNFIKEIELKCSPISKTKFNWMPGGGNDTNWHEFGIPNCSGTASGGGGDGGVSGAEKCRQNPSDPVCKAFKATCYKKTDGTYIWVSSTGALQADWAAVADSFCSASGGGGGGNGDGSHSNWVSKTWTFNDGTSNSMILNRTDSEYLNFIKEIELKCSPISKTKFNWMPGGGNDTNWHEFGIPNCSGTMGVIPPIDKDRYTMSCYRRPDGSYVSVSSTGAIQSDWVGVDQSYCSGKKDEPKMCAINPHMQTLQNEGRNLNRMDKELGYLQGDESLKSDLRAKIQDAYKAMAPLGTMASETSCGAKDEQAFQKALQDFRETVVRPIQEAFKTFGNQGDLSQFKRELQMRIEYLTRDRERFASNPESAARVDGWIKAHQDLLSSLTDQTNLDEFKSKLHSLEEEMKAFYSNRHDENRDQFLGQTIAAMRQNLAQARKTVCEGVKDILDKLEARLNDAEAAYKNGDVKTASGLLQETEKGMQRYLYPAMQHCQGTPVPWEQVDIKKSFENVQGVNQTDIAAIVAQVTENLTNKIQLLVDETMKGVMARVAELHSISQEAQQKVTQSLGQLQTLSDEYRDVLTQVKQTMIEKTQALEQLADEAKSTLRAPDRSRLNKAIETIATYNWCGRLGDELKSEADTLIVAFENNKVTSRDVSDFEKKVNDSAAQNGQACYATGASKFIDTPTHVWYFAPFQNERWQGTKTAGGQSTGNVEPDRQALGAEAMITVMRSAGYQNIEGQCPVRSAVRDATHVPTWSSCAANVASTDHFLPTAPLDQPIQREQVAQMMVNVMKDKGLLVKAGLEVKPEEASKILEPYGDRSSCTVPPEVIATMVQSNLMVGTDGKWNCTGALNRAELATVLQRFDDMLKFYAK